MKVGVIKMKKTLLILIGIIFIAQPLFSKAYYNDKQHQQELEQIEGFVKNKDVKGLTKIVEKGEIRSKEIAARWLGDLGDESAIPILKKMNDSYAGFECHPSGEFAVAICKIESRNKTDKEKIKALLKLTTEHATSVASLAAIEISKFNDPSILPELRKLKTYGAVQAVIKLESLDLTQEQKITKLIQILNEHKSPLLAEGAENLLIEIGEPVVPKVINLLTNIDAGNFNTLRQSFNVRATIATRCIKILEKIGNKNCILAIGNKIYDSNIYVKGYAVSSLQRITKENFGFDLMYLRMEKDKEKYERMANESIKKAQKWWKENRNSFE